MNTIDHELCISDALRGLGFAALLAFTVPTWAEALERGGTVTATVTLEPISFDPLRGNATVMDFQPYRQLFDSLLTQTKAGDVVPHLAESYKVADDRLSVTFKIREGVTFHDGTPVNAEAVVYNLNRIPVGELPSIYSTHFTAVENAEALSEYEVRVNLSEPSSTFLEAMAGIPGMIVSPTAMEALGEDFGVNPVGSGPFVFESRQGGASLTLRRNPNYWIEGADGEPLPYLDQIVFRWLTQPSTKVIELTSGNVDIVDRIDAQDFARIEADPDLDLVDSGGIMQWMSFNLVSDQFDDVMARQAVAYGIDNEAIARIVAGDYWQITPTFVHPTQFMFDDSLPIYAHDPERAKELLAEAGFSEANPLNFELTMQQREPDITIAQIMQAQLAEIGVGLELKIMERQALLDQFRSASHHAGFGATPSPNPASPFYNYLDRNALPRTGVGNDEVFALLDKAKAAGDTEELKDLYIQIQQKIIDEAMFIWMFMRDEKQAYNTRVQDFDLGYFSVWPLERVWVAQ